MTRFIILVLFVLSPGISKEVKIRQISLSGLITNPKQEISGMDWYKDNLFLLPENLGGFLFMIPKNQIQDALRSNNSEPILPRQIKFTTPDYSSVIDGFDGLEAIAFQGKKVLISIEAESNDTMVGYVAWGQIDPETFAVKIPKENLKKIETPIQISNMTYESIIVHNNRAVLIYEANGLNLQETVQQPVVSLLHFSAKKMKSPNIEYRITDATRIDQNGRFWAINYFWPGDKKRLKPAADPIAETSGKGKTHQSSDVVERLIEFEIKDEIINFSDHEPIQLELDKDAPRNWEGIVRIDDIGFLIATDKHPEMILGFVPVK